jgi:hypothetical protein
MLLHEPKRAFLVDRALLAEVQGPRGNGSARTDAPPPVPESVAPELLYAGPPWETSVGPSKHHVILLTPG